MIQRNGMHDIVLVKKRGLLRILLLAEIRNRWGNQESTKPVEHG